MAIEHKYIDCDRLQPGKSMSAAHRFFDHRVRVNRILLEHLSKKRISASDENSNLVSSCGWDRSGGHFCFPQDCAAFFARFAANLSIIKTLACTQCWSLSSLMCREEVNEHPNRETPSVALKCATDSPR